MADYKTAIKRILLSEGGYVNDPMDNGGETYKGISRKNWPKWMGWLYVDQAKKVVGFPKSLNANRNLQYEVDEFYKENFWDKLRGDFIASQSIANMLVDSAVNEGVKAAVKRAQKLVLMTQTGFITPELVTKLNSMI